MYHFIKIPYYKLDCQAQSYKKVIMPYTYQNKFDTKGEARINGAQAEEQFKDALGIFFYAGVRKSNFQEELQHVDYHCKMQFKVDVKSIKDSSTIWVEIKNVQGEKGWLYGSATHFAFERDKYFVMVRKEDLIKLVKRLTTKERVQDPKDALYKLYSRTKYGRKDLLTKITPKDLRSIPHVAISKL